MKKIVIQRHTNKKYENWESSGCMSYLWGYNISYGCSSCNFLIKAEMNSIKNKTAKFTLNHSSLE